jgi:hypothetical protein
VVSLSSVDPPYGTRYVSALVTLPESQTTGEGGDEEAGAAVSFVTTIWYEACARPRGVADSAVRSQEKRGALEVRPSGLSRYSTVGAERVSAEAQVEDNAAQSRKTQAPRIVVGDRRAHIAGDETNLLDLLTSKPK